MSHSSNPVPMTPRKIRLVIKLALPLLLCCSFVWVIVSKSGLYPSQRGLRDPESFRAFYLSGNSSTSLPLTAINESINRINQEQKITNQHLLTLSNGHLLPTTPVIVVQVHNRGKYLEGLIYSLSKVAAIQDSLLIFSHDVYDDTINQIIRDSVNFVPYLQIFYPSSLQLNPSQFPGNDPKDCPRDISVAEAIRVKCINSGDPDAYGHYREATYTQTKHHWFWKGNFALNGLKVTTGHDGPFVLLEEDHYVAPDLIHFLHLMESFKENRCKDCYLLTLGGYAKTVNFAMTGDKVEVVRWYSSRHNMGLVFNRDFWTRLTNCAEPFCTYDDYNWDWSLQRVLSLRKCFPSIPARTVIASAPRVFHVGECGVHHKGKDCFDFSVTKRVQNLLDDSRKWLFPSKIVETKTIRRNSKMPKVNGGWSDRRDHQLCLNHLHQLPH